MTLKQMAMLNVAKLLAVGIAGAVVVNISLHYLGLAWTGAIGAGLLLAWMVRFVYDVELAKLEAKNSLEKIRNS